MAHGWDSYYHDIPPLSSDPGTLRRTSESEGSLSQHMDNFIGHHEFPGSGASHEATSTNSNFNTNYYSNPSVGNSNSDCAYQRYYKETQWQADGEQMEKDYLPRCGNGDLDFTLDGLSTSESFSSSLPADLQGLKQDCSMLASSMLEDYSDVSSCSDADVRETRPSCQFMASNPPAKSKTDSIKHSSSEWLFPRTRNMTIPTESPCLSMSETDVTLQSLSNEMARENKTDCAPDKIKSPKSTVDSYGGHNQCSTTTNMVTTTWSETEERNLDEAFKDEKQKERVESDFTNKYSNISASDNFTGDEKEKYPDDNEEKIDSTAPTIKATFQDDGGQDKSEIQGPDRGETGSSENKIIDKQIPPNPTSTDGQGERQSEFTSTLKISSCEAESCLQLPKCVASHPELCLEPSHSNTDLNCNGPADSVSIDTSNGKKQGITSHLESCLQQNSASTDVNTCPKTVMTSAAENTNTTSADPVLTSDSVSVDTSDKTTQGVACREESSSTDMNTCLVNDMTNVADNTKSTSLDPGCNGPNVTSDNVSIDTSNKNKQGVASDVESCSQHNSSSPDVNRCKESEMSSQPEKKTTTSLTDPVCFRPVLTSDNIEGSACNSLELCLQSNTSCTDINPCLEMEWTRPAGDTNAPSSPDQQPSLHQSPMDLEPQSVSEDVAENARESFEEMDTSTEEPSVLDMLYGEPLSREDSCDADDTKLNEISLLRTDINTMMQSKLQSSIQMRKRLQPIVILQAESTNGISDSYHCANCQHTTQTVDNLIEHHHCCHSVPNFQFCKTCNLYLTTDEEAEQHLCGLTRNTSQLSSDCSIKKIKKKGRHKCIQCKLFFVKRYQYIKHMRLHTGTTPFRCDGCGLYFSQGCSMHRHKLIPGRCKRTKLRVTSSDAVTSETQTPPQKVLVESQPSTNLPKCFVKLVNMSNLNVCCVCGRSFSTAKKAKKHFYNVHKGKKLAILQCPSTRKRSVVESQTVEKEPREQTVEKEPKGQVVEKEAGGKYKCTLCPKFFKYSYNRARHLRDCVKEKIFGGKEKVGGRYRCPLCYATFSLSSNRYRHINTCCLRVYLGRLAREAQSRARTKQKKTKETEQKSLSKETEQKSLSKETEQKSLSKESGQKKQSKESGQKKQSKESGQKKQSKESEQIKLPKQNEQIKQVSPALTAPKTVPRYKCQQCPAVFYHASGKYRHMKKHEIFKLTGKMFKYRLSVFSAMSKPAALNTTKTEENKEDLTSTEANSSPTLSCHFCGKCFSTEQSLKKHERSHRGERPYRCLECGKGFKRRAYLLGHKIVHQRRIQCTVCRKIVPTIKELIQHRSTHLKRGKLQCPDCHLQFQYPAHLLRHLNSHRKRDEKATRLEEKPQLKPQQSLESVKEDSEPKQLQCSLCKEVFNDAQVLRKHCLTHIRGSLSHQCPFCKHNFNSRRYLLRHMIKHTGDKAFSCPHCGKQFYRDNYFKLHSEHCGPTQTREVVKEEPVTKPKGTHHCSYCPRVFSKKMRLKNHHRAHKAKTMLKCERCGQYYGMTKLNSHQKDCVGTKLNTGLSSSIGSFTQTVQKVPKISLQSSDTKILPLKCPHCTRRFRYRSLLLRHVVSHTGILPYACVHCGHRYRSRTTCLQHEAFCDGVFRKGSSKDKGDAAKQLSNMPTLRAAVQKPQAGGESEYKCKFCTKTFMKPRNLRRHILTHNEVKPYRCKTCDSCYSRYDHLKVHQVRCRGKRSRLEICIPKISLDDVGKGWQSKFGTEPAEKQETFECKICSRLFPTETKLSRHNTLFHTVKLYKCHGCGSSFSHEKTLKKHRKMRKCRKVSKEADASPPVEANPPTENVTQSPGVRNQILQRIQPQFSKKYKYLCTYCPRAFGNSYQLGVHIRLHTGERPYGCEDCGLRFIRKDYLQRHTPKCTKKRKQTKVLCDRCGGFFLEVKLEDHKKSCTSSPSSSKSTVQQNQQSASQSPPKGFSCAYCNSRFLLFSQLQEHFLNAHKMETIVPPASTAPLQHHLSNIPNIKEEPLDKSSDEQVRDDANVVCDLNTDLHKTVEKPFPCPQCKMSFVSKGGLMGHMRVHTMQPPFRCKTCKRGFWNKTTLRNHYRKCRFGRIKNKDKSQESEAPLKAEIDFTLTDEVFKDGSKTTSTGDLQTSFACKEEPMDESPQNFEGSEVQSSPKKEKKAVKYQCSECDMSFTDGLLLISHLEDHGRQEQEKKRNTCTKCGRVCSSPGNLEKHMRSHGINKKYSCTDCSKTFDSYSDFESHKKCHDPNRPFACKLCNERFSSRPFLGSHYSEDHPDDVYTCQFCGKSYSVKKSMQRHIKKWHQKEKSLVSNVQEKRSAEQQPSSKLSVAAEQQPSSKVSVVTEQQPSSKVSTTGESEEDENNISEYSEDSDSAPYFPCHVCGKTFSTSESLEDHQLCHLGEKPHECAECGRCFFQASQLQQHQRMHKSEFQCQACGRGFVSLFALRKHKHTHGKNRPYRCSKCELSFTGPLQLAEHMSAHREENFPCDICNRVFSSKSSRAEHWKSHSRASDHQPQLVSKEEHEKSASLSEGSAVSHKELKYRCGVCSERFRDPEKLSEHGCMAAKERPYSCSDCDKHFLHASHLKKHRATHEQSWSSIEYPCNQCNSSFSSSQQFLSHLKGHVDEGPSIKREDTDEDPSHGFICPVCHQCFDSASELIDHFPMHPGRTYECEMCKMTFPSSSELIEHERHHLTSATEFECTECGKSFLGKEAFCQHSCSHQQRAAKEHAYSNQSDKTSPTVEEEEVDVTGEDLHNCPVCSKQFSSKSALLAHQNKQHQNEKPFKCDLCGKAFALRRYLREHERRHRQKAAAQTAETKFKCTQCYTEFSTAQELSLHMRLHAEKQVGEFRCDMCYKSFSQWSLLKQHQESHVGQIVYECDECDKAFAFPHLLEEHQQTHAGSSA